MSYILPGSSFLCNFLEKKFVSWEGRWQPFGRSKLKARNSRQSTSDEKFIYDFPVHIRQTKMPALVLEGQLGMIHSQVFEHGGV